jgi:hypothetical protein
MNDRFFKKKYLLHPVLQNSMCQNLAMHLPLAKYAKTEILLIIMTTS